MDYVISKLTEKIIALEQNASDGHFPTEGWDFFKNDLENEWVICYLSNKDNTLFINSFLLKKSLFPKNCDNALLDADYSTIEGWGVAYGNKTSRLLKSFFDGRTPPLNQAEPLFFLRYFEGYAKDSNSYLEINQKITTSLGLHWMPEKKAYCILNRLGDFVPQILMDKTDNQNYLLIRRNTLDKFLSITNCVLIRCFEYRQLNFDIKYSWPSRETELTTIDENFCFKKVIFFENNIPVGISIRGYNKITQNKNYNQIEQEEHDTEGGETPLEFIIKDIKHGGKPKKIKLLQENLSSYFETSENPFETSPVFFKPEVLNKYINDPEKYSIRERDISCRGGWHLPTFDTNEQGQVHTLAIYLTYLPFEELCHWRCYNETPKGDISKRSFDTDFLAKFSDEPEPLKELKNILKKIWNLKIQPENESLWLPHNKNFDTTFFGFYYFLGGGYIQWQNYIQDLSRIVSDGLSKDTINKISKRLGCYDAQLGSIKLLKKCLQKLSIQEDLIKEIIDPFTNLQKVRSTQTKAHRELAKPNSNDLKKDAMDHLKSITEALTSLETLCSKGKLNG